VIHAADTAALEAGATLDTVLETCAAVGARVPVALMCYANMILARGADQFAAEAAAAGAAAVIVPDLPLEEQDAIAEALAARDLALVPLVAPTPRRSAAPRSARAPGVSSIWSRPSASPASATSSARARRADRRGQRGDERPGRGRLRDLNA
jgi:tryptophan synthase alpha chain